MTGGADLLNVAQQGVSVAIDAQLEQALVIAAGFALAPKLSA